MWTRRTPEEAAKWYKATAREARTSGLILGGVSWLGITAMLAGGWVAGGRAGVIAQDSVAGGSFWSRFPIFALMGLPIGFWLSRRESRGELERSLQMTICPKCETAGEANADTACDCGGTFLLQSSVRWVEEPDPEKDDHPD